MEPAMSAKLLTLPEAARLVGDGEMIALGGNSLTRLPSAFARELARQGKRGLRLVKTAGAYDIDLLCAAQAAVEVHSGYVGFENLFGLAPSYRKGVESGAVRAVEHACYTVIAGLRASAYGIPSQPVAGLQGSDVPGLTGFKEAADPYTGAKVFMVPRIRPRWAVLHVPWADAEGNARIEGGTFEDVLMTRAAEGVILTAERIAETSFFEARPERTQIPAFLVHAVVHAHGGARPGAGPPFYDLEEEAVARYLEQSASAEGLAAHLAEWEEKDHRPAEARSAPGERP